MAIDNKIIPEMDNPEMDNPEMDNPEMDNPEMDNPEMDILGSTIVVEDRVVLETIAKVVISRMFEKRVGEIEGLVVRLTNMSLTLSTMRTINRKLPEIQIFQLRK
jgi:hypothetical protein